MRMSLHDCPKCWDNPCTCGYQYQNWTKEKKMEVIQAILNSDKTAKENDRLLGSMIFGGDDE